MFPAIEVLFMNKPV